MERLPVRSSDLKSVGYLDSILEIEFRSGGVYQYHGVPEHVYTRLMSAPSKGRYFHRAVRSVYPYTRLG